MDRAVLTATADLYLSVSAASVSGVERALAARASVHGTPTISPVPPICCASNYGYVDIIKALLRGGADLEIATGDGCDSTGAITVHFDGGPTAVPLKRSRSLHAAIYGGKLEALRVLLRAGANPNSTDADDATPLRVACDQYCDTEQRMDVLHILLNAGADPTLKDINGALPIHLAAANGAAEAVIVLLTKVPSTINVMDKKGFTPLEIAAVGGKASIVSFLLSAGAREPEQLYIVNGMPRDGALLCAVAKDQRHVVRILLDQGLEAVGGLLMVPEAMRNSIQWERVAILRMLLNVQGEKRQEFWANRPVYHSRQPFAEVFPATTTRGQLNAIMAVKAGIPMLHVAARYCSLRSAHVLLSAGADEAAVGTQGKRASELVGDFQTGSKKDVVKESAFRRMLQRGPAFRAHSWAWMAETDPSPDIAVSTTSSAQRVPAVRIYRARADVNFGRRCARYAVKGDLPFLRLPFRGCY